MSRAQERLALTLCHMLGQSNEYQILKVSLCNNWSVFEKYISSNQSPTTKCGKYFNTITIKHAQFPLFFLKVLSPFNCVYFIILGNVLMSQIHQLIRAPYLRTPYFKHASILFCCLDRKKCWNCSPHSASAVFSISSLQSPPGSFISTQYN